MCTVTPHVTHQHQVLDLMYVCDDEEKPCDNSGGECETPIERQFEEERREREEETEFTTEEMNMRDGDGVSMTMHDHAWAKIKATFHIPHQHPDTSSHAPCTHVIVTSLASLSSPVVVSTRACIVSAAIHSHTATLMYCHIRRYRCDRHMAVIHAHVGCHEWSSHPPSQCLLTLLDQSRCQRCRWWYHYTNQHDAPYRWSVRDLGDGAIER